MTSINSRLKEHKFEIEFGNQNNIITMHVAEGKIVQSYFNPKDNIKTVAENMLIQWENWNENQR